MTGFLNALPGAVSQGLIWGIMAIGVYITYKILDIADLTVDGSFCTGGAVFVMLFSSGVNVWLAMLAALLAGMLAGLCTGLLHTVCGISAILAGILTQLGLFSVNMAIMNFMASVTLPITQAETLDRMLISLRFVQGAVNGSYPLWRHPIITVGVITAVLIAVLYWFFGTELGASLRATGSNPNMARAQGINTNWTKVLGLVISNGLVALSGALLCQYNGGNEINVGRGAIVIGLAAVIIGEVLFSKIFRNFALKLLAVSFGAVVYYAVIQAILQVLKVFDSTHSGNYLKLMQAAMVAVFLTIPHWKDKYFSKTVKPAKKEESAHA